jgi:hypothetical protein
MLLDYDLCSSTLKNSNSNRKAAGVTSKATLATNVEWLEDTGK